MAMLKGNRILVVLFLLSILGYSMIALFTIDPKYSSGNGNPALLAIIPTVPIFICFLIFSSYRCFIYLNKRRIGVSTFVIIGSAVIFIISFYFETKFVQYKISKIDPAYHPFPSGEISLNQFTNTIFFNGFTFVICLFFVILMAAVGSVIKKYIRSNK